MSVVRLHANEGRPRDAGSYTARLLDDPSLLAAKLKEEARELVEAGTRDAIVHEAADVLYFTLARLAAEGIGLDRRERRVTRRGGGRKTRILAVREAEAVKTLAPVGADPETETLTRRIVDDVRERGLPALREHGQRFGDLGPETPVVIDAEQLRDAVDTLEPDDRAMLERVAERVRGFADAQRACLENAAVPVPGGEAGHVEAVEQALAEQMPRLATADVAARALAESAAVVVADDDEAIALCDRLAPEHLQVQTSDADAIASRFRHDGSIFVGAGSAVVLGDDGIGPNHTLPTGGAARSAGGLSVLSFLRMRTWLRVADADDRVLRDTARLAAMEGLVGHAAAAERRRT